jgi:hypothetical protein
MPKVIADTSPIQYLYQTNLLDLLPPTLWHSDCTSSCGK